MTVIVSYTDTAGNTQSDTQSIGLSVVDAGTELVIDGLESKLEPGKTGKVKIGVKNIGEVDLENLYFSITTPAELSLVGPNEKMVNRLGVGETAYVEFEFDVSQDAEARPAESTLIIKYRRAGGKKELTESKPIGITLEGKVELRVIKVSVDKSDAQIEVDIANYGNKDADAIKIEAESGGRLIGTGFTDKIKPNKHKVFRFDMPPAQNVLIRLTYKDYKDNNGFAVVEEFVTLEKKDIAPQSNDPIMMVVAAAIVIVVALWYLRRRRNNKVKIDVSKYR